MGTRAARRKTQLTQAQKADKYKLYETSVQAVDAEIDFVDRTYKKIRGRRAVTLREDFCGTMNTSCEWIRRRRNNIAYGVDIDETVLAWGRKHHLARLSHTQRQRIHVIQDDVLVADTPAMDMVLAMNFSYWIFKTRQDMIAYFRQVYRCLAVDGIFFLDGFGGYEAFKEMTETTKLRGYSYIWDQHKYNPITGEGLFHIHFHFKDGSKIRKAFTYDWRVWTLPELTEMLTEAGFRPAVYWEGTARNGEGNGVFTRTTRGEADASWIVYIVGEK